MQFTEIMARFRQTSEHPDGGYAALCPAHNDSRPSLRVWRGDDHKVRVTCRAGCATGDILDAVGLSWPDLFNATGVGLTVPSERSTRADTALIAQLAMYVDYTTACLAASSDMAANARQYAEERFGLSVSDSVSTRIGLDTGTADADFEYRSPAFRRYARLTVPLNDFQGVTRGLQGRDLSGLCPGRWLSLSNPQGMHWAQYGVFRGSGGYGVTLVTEGPGDALTAVAVGYDAVAVRGASLASRPDLVAELAAGLAGTQVIVCGDDDPAGRAFTIKLCEGLAGHGIDVYTLSVPVAGGDLTDWRSRDPGAFPAALHGAVRRAQPARGAEETAQDTRAAEVSERTGVITVTDTQGREAAQVIADLIRAYDESDTANAYALVAWSNGHIKYADGLGFHVWNGTTWTQSTTRVRQEIHRMGAALVLSGNVKEARGFTMTSRIDALMTELRSVPSVHVDATDFDANPDLISFRNGVVNLRTGALQPHDPDDMITVSLPFDYSPDAPADRWEQFLSEVFPDTPELVPYVRRLVGYGITGNTSEQCFAVLWGKGANGKSVFTDTLTNVFSAVTRTTPFATFEDKQSGGIPNDIAALRGSRLVMASEGESGRPMSEAVLKRVTGKDKVTARFLRQEFFTFTPTFLIMLATNHKPRFKGQDEGLWRRVKLIPFARYFAPHERDHNLDRKLAGETEGIAAWAVRGAVEWYRQGLGDPDVITHATREYRETSDALAGFFPGVLVKDPSSTMLGSDAFNAYLDWCEAENLPGKERWTRRTFFTALEERGVSKRRVTKGVSLTGVRVATDDDSVTPPETGPGIFAR